MSSGIAIFGAGIFPKEAYIPALVELGEKAPTLKAVYSRSEKSAQDLAETAATSLKLSPPPTVYHDGDKSRDLDALLARSDIIAVIIALPISLQPTIIRKALAAGKHVLSEKPVAADVKQGLELIETYNSEYKRKGLIWRVAENFEAEPGFRAAASIIRSGKIGKVIFFKTVIVNRMLQESKWYNTPWRTVPDYQGGFLLDGGVHTIAALRLMLPHQLTQLSGFASLNKEYLKPHDTINAVVRAGDHFHGIIEMTFASPTNSRPKSDEYTITGTDGWLAINFATAESSNTRVIRITVQTSVQKKGEQVEEKEETIEEPTQGVKVEFESFFNAIQGKDDGLGLGGPLGALQDVAVIQAALNSDGNLVDLTKLVPISQT